MTARPLRSAPQPGRIRVIGGRPRLRRPAVSPFLLFGVVIIASMIGIVVARTSLDAGAFRIAELEVQIQEEQRLHETLTLEIARLESPTRVGPLAEEMGMIPAAERTMLVVEPERAAPDDYDGTRLAMGETSREAAPAGESP